MYKVEFETYQDEDRTYTFWVLSKGDKTIAHAEKLEDLYLEVYSMLHAVQKEMNKEPPWV